MLPLAPPGRGWSPYQAYSAFAGNPLLLSPDDLVRDGLLGRSDLITLPAKSSVDFAAARASKERMLEMAWRRFNEGAVAPLRRGFRQFRKRERWLEDYALFTVLQKEQPGGMQRWPLALRQREAVAMNAAREKLRDAVERECFIQFLFWRQITALRAYATARGVRLIGDIPIFVSGESADVWTHPHLFKLDQDGRPKVISGVPPDAFSKDGQLWGNPLYDWRAMEQDGYGWWIRRMRKVLEQCDVARIDHFRGFAAAWEVPAGAGDARGGKWVRGCGAGLFNALRAEFGKMPVIAEDLGLITPDVIALRERFNLPGMRVLQFAFGSDAENPHLPHNYVANAVAYTGTHDNDTTRGWYSHLPARARTHLHRYAPGTERAPVRTLTRLAWQSVAAVAIVPLQDVLNLGSEARMNMPGVADGNWGWRVRPEALIAEAFHWIRDLTEMTSRLPIKEVRRRGK